MLRSQVLTDKAQEQKVSSMLKDFQLSNYSNGNNIPPEDDANGEDDNESRSEENLDRSTTEKPCQDQVTPHIQISTVDAFQGSEKGLCMLYINLMCV